MEPSPFDRILGILCSVLDAYSAVMFLPDTEGEGHYLAASFSLGRNVDQTALVREGRGLVGWIVRNREPLLVANFDQRRNHLGYYLENEEQNIKAFMGCSLPGPGGALCVDSKRQYSFSEKDQKILHLFADLAAQLSAEKHMEETRRLSLSYYAALRAVYALRHQYTRWQDFLRHFLDLAATMTGFSYCALCTREPDGAHYTLEGENTPLLQGAAGETSFPMTHGVAGWVFRNGAAVMSEGPDGSPPAPLMGRGQELPTFQAVMAQPLIFHKKTRGVLCFGHDTPMEIPEATKDFVRMASEHLALFLENLYIKSRFKDLHQHYQALTSPPEK